MSDVARYVLRDGVLVPMSEVELLAESMHEDYHGPAQEADQLKQAPHEAPPIRVIRRSDASELGAPVRSRVPASWSDKRARQYHAVLFDESVQARVYGFKSSADALEALPMVKERFGGESRLAEVEASVICIDWPASRDPSPVNAFMHSLGGETASHHKHDKLLAEALAWHKAGRGTT